MPRLGQRASRFRVRRERSGRPVADDHVCVATQVVVVSQRRRLVSPALLLAVLLCFFLPFFSVSSSGVGQMKATVTGMDQVFGGEPEYTGFRVLGRDDAAGACPRLQRVGGRRSAARIEPEIGRRKR
jgi:hypothetical protein